MAGKKCEPDCKCDRHKTSDETRRKKAESQRRRWESEEARRKQSETARAVWTDEKKAEQAKLSTCEPGCTCGKHSFEASRKRSESLTGKAHSESHRKANSEAHLGIPTVHGLSKHQSYVRWQNMISRCHNENHPSYDNYGGRGIQVCEEWRGAPDGVVAFLTYLDNTLGPCPGSFDIDRINNDGNYEPGNIRWVSRSDNLKNKRKSKRRT